MPRSQTIVLSVGIVVFSLVFSLPSTARTLIFKSQPQASPEQSNSAEVSAPASVPAENSTSYTTARTPNSVSPSAVSELLFMIEQLQQEVRTLRGLVEEQSYALRSLQESGKARYRDLDARVMALTRAASASPAVSGTGTTSGSIPESAVQDETESTEGSVSTTQPPSEDQKRAYQSAYQLIKERKFDEAVDALHGFIDKYPEGELSGNAYYWLGEVYLVLPKLEQAKQAFSIVVKSFPNHRKLPDAMFKLAVTHDRMQDPAASEKLLNEVQQKFPQSTAAKLAESYKINR